MPNLPITAFKNDSGTFYTQGLFFEYTVPPRPTCLYTLKRFDHPQGYPSLRRLYLEMEDITGYNFSEEYLGGWDHLQKLLELSWFRTLYESWQDELEVKLRAKSLARLIEASTNKEDKKYLELNKFLLQSGWKSPDEKKRRGAPTKAEIRREAITIAENSEMVSSDFRRATEGLVN